MFVDAFLFIFQCLHQTLMDETPKKFRFLQGNLDSRSPLGGPQILTGSLGYVADNL